jgi:hypothetical protein
LSKALLLYIVLAALVTLPMLLWGQPHPLRTHLGELAAAKARWNANPVRHYRIRVTTVGRGYYCEQDIEVQDEQVKRIYVDTCGGFLSLTVSYLFVQAEDLLPRQVRWNGGYGCEIKVSRSEFHPEWGLPMKVLVRYEELAPENVGAFRASLIAARQRTHGVRCSHTLPPFTPYSAVVSFTPLP